MRNFKSADIYFLETHHMPCWLFDPGGKTIVYGNKPAAKAVHEDHLFSFSAEVAKSIICNNGMVSIPSFRMCLYVSSISINGAEFKLLTAQQENHLKVAPISEVHFQQAVTRSSIVTVTDKKGNIIYVNNNFIVISGYNESELIGQSHRIVNSGFHTSEFWKDMWRTVLTGDTWRREVKN